MCMSILMPSVFRIVTTGVVAFVNIHRANDSPNSRQLDWNILPLDEISRVHGRCSGVGLQKRRLSDRSLSTRQL